MGSLFAKLFAPLMAAAAVYVVPWLIKVAIFTLGLGVITLVGVDLAFDYAIGMVMARYNGLPADLIQWVDYIGVFDAISILTSAMSASVALKFLCGTAGAGAKVKKLDFTC